MSIVDDAHHVGNDNAGPDPAHQGAEGGLWRAAAPQPTAKARSAKSGRALTRRRPVVDDAIFDLPSSGELWRSKIDLVVSAALSGEAARRDDHDSRRAQSELSFDSFRQYCDRVVRPVLESSAEMLGRWGLEARVSEHLRDLPARLPRSFDVCLSVDRFGGRGPGRLTITATESCEFVRVKIKIGPTQAGEVDEHVGTTLASDLSDALVGGLVATLVERVFTP